MLKFLVLKAILTMRNAELKKSLVTMNWLLNWKKKVTLSLLLTPLTGDALFRKLCTTLVRMLMQLKQAALKWVTALTLLFLPVTLVIFLQATMLS